MTSFGFEDEAHVLRIAEALWSHAPTGSAALLVGAGFSQNAVAARATAPPMAGWNQIYEAMVNALYGLDADAAADRSALLGQRGATSAYLRVAEEFEAEFKRTALDRLIRKQVPDLEYAPGELHRQLLELPWADILTTNWDTLLERAATTTEDRVYDVVRTIEEIPETHAPRIVKLHGSLPAHRPFIFTEEDFRTYPANSAAFINLAQQITMENTLVLIGFSGDDPNFLFWSGWVRDRLGPHAPLIYLVGALGLSPSKRKMLERRLVQPIDLARLPAFATWPVEQQHARSTRWFIEQLRAAEPYRRRRWPRQPSLPYPPFELVQPRRDPNTPAPLPHRTGEPASTTAYIRELVPVWRQHRSIHPGWIIAPPSTRNTVWQETKWSITGVRSALDQMGVAERLQLLFETNWRFEVALIPLVIDLDDYVAPLLETLSADYEKLTIEQQDQLRHLGLALVRHLREEHDEPGFMRWTTWLDERCRHRVEEYQRLRYERCLWYQGHLDVDALEAAVDQWQLEGDPFWRVRKAAMLVDLGRARDAEDLTAVALAEVRARTDKTSEDLASWSRESFVMLLRSSLLGSSLAAWTIDQAERERYGERQELLASRGYDGLSDFQNIATELAQAPPLIIPTIERKLRFNIGTENTTTHFASPHPVITRLAALQALHFVEEAGLPARGFAGSVLRRAAVWLADVMPERAFDLFLRDPGGSDDDIELLFSRRNVARLSESHADRLFERLLRLIHASRARLLKSSEPHSIWSDRLRKGLDLLSRLVLRVSARAPETITLATALFQTPGLIEDQRLTDKVSDLLQRALETMAPADADREIAVLYRLLPVEAQRIPEIPDAITKIELEYISDPRAREWSETITQLLEVAHPPAARQAALARLLRIGLHRNLTDAERKRFAKRIWQDLGEDGLPRQMAYYPATLIDLPYPPAIDVVARVKAATLPTAPWGDAQVADPAVITTVRNKKILFTDIELATLTNALLAWCAASAERENESPTLQLGGGETATTAAARLFFQMSRRCAPGGLAADALGQILEVKELHFEVDAALPELVRLKLIPSEDAGKRLAVRIEESRREDRQILGMAFSTLATASGPLEAWESALWMRAALSVTSRRPETLVHFLSAFGFAYLKHSTRVPPEIDPILEAATSLILLETETYGNEPIAYDTVAARYFGAYLVAAMAQAGRISDATNGAWKVAAATDTLPDVRRGFARAHADAAAPKLEE